MNSNKRLEVLENSAVQDHIAMLQGIINRMANNSANCKNWTITLVAAMLVLLVDKDMEIPNAWICLIPIGLFYLLDCYYLGLERLCITSQYNFLDKINKGQDYTECLYNLKDLKGGCSQFCSTINAMWSISTTPFYLIVSIIVILFGGVI